MRDDSAATADWSVGELVYVAYLGVVALAWVVVPMLMVLLDR